MKNDLDCRVLTFRKRTLCNPINFSCLAKAWKIALLHIRTTTMMKIMIKERWWMRKKSVLRQLGMGHKSWHFQNWVWSPLTLSLVLSGHSDVYFVSKCKLLSCSLPEKHLIVLWFDANKLCLVCTFLLKYELVSTPWILYVCPYNLLSIDFTCKKTLQACSRSLSIQKSRHIIILL